MMMRRLSGSGPSMLINSMVLLRYLGINLVFGCGNLKALRGMLMKLIHGGLIAVALFFGITGVGAWVLR